MTSRDKLEQPEVFDKLVKVICEVYANAEELHKAGVHVVSVDEKTGMQAVERKYPTKPSRPGLIERRSARVHPSRDSLPDRQLRGRDRPHPAVTYRRDPNQQGLR